MDGIADQLVIRNMHSVRDLFTHWYGVLATTKPVEADFSPAGTAIVITEPVYPRIGRLISNTGAAAVAVGFSAAVTLTTGIYLTQGQALSLSWLEDGELLFYPMWLISTAGGGTVHVVNNCLVGG